MESQQGSKNYKKEILYIITWIFFFLPFLYSFSLVVWRENLVDWIIEARSPKYDFFHFLFRFWLFRLTNWLEIEKTVRNEFWQTLLFDAYAQFPVLEALRVLKWNSWEIFKCFASFHIQIRKFRISNISVLTCMFQPLPKTETN